MAKYSQEFKLQVVEYYLSNQGGQKATACYFNIDHSTVRKWVATYEIHGKQGLLKQVSRSTYSVEFKQEVVLCMINKGLSSREIVKRFRLKERNLAVQWLRQYQACGIEGLKPKPKGRPKHMSKPKLSTSKQDKTDHDKTHNELLEELTYLRAEVAYLKKLQALKLEQEAIQHKLQDLSQD